MVVLTRVPVRIPECGTLQEIALTNGTMPLASPCLNRQQAQLACSAAGSLRFGYLSQAWAFLLAIAWSTQFFNPSILREFTC